MLGTGIGKALFNMNKQKLQPETDIAGTMNSSRSLCLKRVG